MNKFLILVAVLPLVLADLVPVQNCQSGSPPVAVDVEGCTSLPCQLPRGEDVIAYVDFSPAHDVSKLRPVVNAKAMGITVPFELPEDRQDGCEWLEGTRCPLSAGEDVRYELRLPVKKIYPAILVDVQLMLVDQDEQVVSCFSVQAKVV